MSEVPRDGRSMRQAADDAFADIVHRNPLLARARAARATGLVPYYREQLPQGLNRVTLGEATLLQLGASNYLGLANDVRIRHAVSEALELNGTSCTSSRLLTGSRPVHHELEAALAQFLDKEACLVFPTGYLANVGTIPALVTKGDEVFYDEQVHACLIDGIRLSGADAFRFRHNNVEHLEAKLSKASGKRRLVVLDSLYSLTGDLAPLKDIVDAADHYGAWVFLDDAHGTGVLGPAGQGLAHGEQVQDRVPIIMGVFSKSLASTGGFIASSADVIDHLRYGARSYLFSNAIAPAQAAAALAALRVLQAEPDLPRKAIALGERARKALREMGWRCGGDKTQMTPILVGDDILALRISERLEHHGVCVSPAVYPGVPKGRDLLRINFPPNLTDADFDGAMSAFAQVATEFAELTAPGL